MTDSDSTAPAEVHNQFNAVDADIILISSDNVKFKVHKGALKYNSVIFRDMLDAGTGCRDNEVPMTEPASILAQLLPYCYHDRIPPIDYLGAGFWPLVRAFDKYEIGRGRDAVVAACRMAALETPRDPTAVVHNYLIAVFCHLSNIETSVGQIVSSELPWDTLSPIVAAAMNAGVSDGGKHMGLMFRRFSIMSQKWSGELSETWAASIVGHAHKEWTSDIADAVRTWNGAGRCTGRASLDRYLLGKRCSIGSPPWDALRAVLDSLPTKLE